MKKKIVRVTSVIILCIVLKALLYDMPQSEWHKTIEEAYNSEAKEDFTLKKWKELNVIFLKEEKEAVVYAGHDENVFAQLIFLKKTKNGQTYYRVIKRSITSLINIPLVQETKFLEWMDKRLQKKIGFQPKIEIMEKEKFVYNKDVETYFFEAKNKEYVVAYQKQY